MCSGSENWLKFGNCGRDLTFIGAIAFSLLPSIVALFLWMLNSTLLTAPLFCSTNHPHSPPGIKLLRQLWPSGFLHSSTTVDHYYFGGSTILTGVMKPRSMTASIVSPGLHRSAITELLSDTGMLLTNPFVMAFVDGVFSGSSPRT